MIPFKTTNKQILSLNKFKKRIFNLNYLPSSDLDRVCKIAEVDQGVYDLLKMLAYSKDFKNDMSLIKELYAAIKDYNRFVDY